MQQRNLIILVAAVAFGLVAVWLANSFFGAVERNATGETAEAAQSAQILVARQDLPFGTPLTAENVRLANWPADSIPAGAVTEADMQRVLQQGSATVRPLVAGEPVLQSRISSRAVLSANIPAEMRAVAIPVDMVTGIAGLVAPGDAVDVLLTRQVSGSGSSADDQIATVILQNVQVLAIDMRASETETQPPVDNSGKPIEARTVTLLVDPLGAQRIALAIQVGKLSLALRNGASELVQPAGALVSRDLGGGGPLISRASGAAASASRPARPARTNTITAPPPPPPPTMEVVRGTNTSIEEVRRHGR